MSFIDKTDQWDDENAGKPLPPTRAQLEARIAELEDALSATIQGIPIVKAELKARIAELEGENARLFKLRVEAAERIAELEAEKQATWDKLVTERNTFATLKAELEAERDRLKAAVRKAFSERALSDPLVKS